jgi:hypothetical protein
MHGRLKRNWEGRHLKVREKMELGCGELQWYNSNELVTRDVVHIFEYTPLNYLLVNSFGVAKVLKPNGVWRKRRSLAGGAAGWLQKSSSGGEFWNQLR